jgi:hypothetical protein
MCRPSCGDQEGAPSRVDGWRRIQSHANQPPAASSNAPAAAAARHRDDPGARG